MTSLESHRVSCSVVHGHPVSTTGPILIRADGPLDAERLPRKRCEWRYDLMCNVFRLRRQIRPESAIMILQSECTRRFQTR